MVHYTPDKLPYKYSVLLHHPQFRDEPCLEVIQRREYFEVGILFTTLDKQQVEALEHLGVVISTDEPVFYSPAKFATLIESLPLLEPLADAVRRAGRVPNKRHG